MTTAIAEPQSPTGYEEPHDDAYNYRAIHAGALLGLTVAIVSLVFPISVAGFADIRSTVLLGVVPAAALVISLWALSQIRANRDLYTGAAASLAGALLAGGSLLGGGAYAGYIYATEVPDGYARTSFYDMKPDSVEVAGNRLVPPDVEELLGEKVFIKGFIRPDSTNSGLRRGISEFLLVRDNNQCCFGDISQVQFYDQIAVKLGPGLTADYSQGVFRLGGELSIRRGNPALSEPTLVYEMKADYLK